ncbi:MAG: heavy-metal-associated domain-containing protein [Thermoleophilaceae bacterium]|nr:heavy-metal-associated domain-containing protein [Thermoleophilaceae bacterium]
MRQTTTYLVPGMSCGHCEAAIAEEVTQVENVDSVEVDLEAKLVRVSGQGIDEAAVIAAIHDAGYEAVRA